MSCLSTQTDSVITKSTAEITKTLKPGILYIFNNRIFDESLGLSERHGWAGDTDSLLAAFAAYDVLIYYSIEFTCSEMFSACSQKKDFSERSCIIVAVLSHGFQNYHIAAKDGIFNFYNMILKICTNPTLKGKPKIFIVQACRGGIDLISKFQSDSGVARSEVNDDIFNSTQSLKLEGEDGNSSKTNLYCDELYLLHSATEEFASYRNPEKGSVFIQEFCKFFQKYAVNVSIEVIFEMVMRSVQKISIKCQQPEIRKNAVKPYIFGNFSDTLENIWEDRMKYALDIDNLRMHNYAECQNLNRNSWVVIEDDFRILGTQFEVELVLPLIKIDNWTRFCLRTAPKYPLIGGHDIDGKILFVGRALLNNVIIPGRVFLDSPQISFAFNEIAYFGYEFEMLNGTGYKWIKSEGNGHIPANAIPGGKTLNDEILYIGRAEHLNSLQPGSIHPSEGCLYVALDGKVLKFLEYEVLVREN